MIKSWLEFNVPFLSCILGFYIVNSLTLISIALAFSFAMNIILFRNLQRMWNS